MVGTPLQRVRQHLAFRRDPVSAARNLGVKVGEGCRFLSASASTFGSEPYLVSIGDHVELVDVRFVTHDGGVWVLRNEFPTIDVAAPITIGDNVFIGHGTLVLPGVTIGSNVVVGARSVVTKSIPSDTVAVGVPCRTISSIDAYRDRAVSRMHPTKGMSPSDKRMYYERIF